MPSAKGQGIEQMEVDGRITTRPSLRIGTKLSGYAWNALLLPSRESNDGGSWSAKNGKGGGVFQGLGLGQKDCGK